MKNKIWISVTPGDPLPIYRQIVEQVKRAVASGLLKSGDRLPTHRDLAKEILIAPLTVKKAYDTLEREGLVLSERGRGTFISGSESWPTLKNDKELDVRAQGLVAQARILGLSREQLLKIVQDAWKKHKEK